MRTKTKAFIKKTFIIILMLALVLSFPATMMVFPRFQKESFSYKIEEILLNSIKDMQNRIGDYSLENYEREIYDTKVALDKAEDSLLEGKSFECLSYLWTSSKNLNHMGIMGLLENDNSEKTFNTIIERMTEFEEEVSISAEKGTISSFYGIEWYSYYILNTAFKYVYGKSPLGGAFFFLFYIFRRFQL